SMTATHEFVVPRSMPMTLAIVVPLRLTAGRTDPLAPVEDRRQRARKSSAPSPLDTRFARNSRFKAHIGGSLGAASQPLTNSRGRAAAAGGPIGIKFGGQTGAMRYPPIHPGAHMTRIRVLCALAALTAALLAPMAGALAA